MQFIIFQSPNRTNPFSYYNGALLCLQNLARLSSAPTPRGSLVRWLPWLHTHCTLPKVHSGVTNGGGRVSKYPWCDFLIANLGSPVIALNMGRRPEIWGPASLCKISYALITHLLLMGTAAQSFQHHRKAVGSNFGQIWVTQFMDGPLSNTLNMFLCIKLAIWSSFVKTQVFV